VNLQDGVVINPTHGEPMDTRPNAHFNDEDSNTSANPAFEQIF
jgi:hypothetical protein